MNPLQGIAVAVRYLCSRGHVLNEPAMVFQFNSREDAIRFARAMREIAAPELHQTGTAFTVGGLPIRIEIREEVSI